jgi:hypothetical protein
MHTALSDLPRVTNYENVRLHDSVNQVIFFDRPRQADIKRSDIYLAVFFSERSGYLKAELDDNLLVRRRWWLSDIGSSIDQLVAVRSGPNEIVGISVVVIVAFHYRHSRPRGVVFRYSLHVVILTR